jgi:quinol monooxygenase YgiN
LIKTAIEVVRELRRQVGCTYVSLSADLEDPDLLHLLQKWESQEALSLNIATPHIAGIAGHAGKLGVREMNLLKYEIGEISPLD